MTTWKHATFYPNYISFNVKGGEVYYIGKFSYDSFYKSLVIKDNYKNVVELIEKSNKKLPTPIKNLAKKSSNYELEEKFYKFLESEKKIIKKMSLGISASSFL